MKTHCFLKFIVYPIEQLERGRKPIHSLTFKQNSGAHKVDFLKLIYDKCYLNGINKFS